MSEQQAVIVADIRPSFLAMVAFMVAVVYQARAPDGMNLLFMSQVSLKAARSDQTGSGPAERTLGAAR